MRFDSEAQDYSPEARPGQFRRVWFEEQTIKNFHEKGPQARYFELAGDGTGDPDENCVFNTLKRPSVILGGVREFQDGGVCYAGDPPCAWTNKRVRIPPPPGFVFTVYVNAADHVYTWRWTKVNSDRPGVPEGYRDTRVFSQGIVWQS